MAFMIQPRRDPKSGMWKIRKGIPAHLRPFLDGKTELKRSLETKDAAEAKSRASVIVAEFEAITANAQLRYDNQEREQQVNPAQLDAIVSHWFVNERQRLSQPDILARYTLETSDGLEAMAEWFSEPLEALNVAEGTLHQQSAEQRFMSHMNDFVDEALTLSQCQLFSHAAKLYLSVKLAEAIIRLCNSAFDLEVYTRRERNRGFEPLFMPPSDSMNVQDFAEKSHAALAESGLEVVPDDVTTRGDLSTSSTVSHLVEWVNTQKSLILGETAFKSWQADRNRPCNRLIEFFGSKPIGQIQKIDMRNFFNWIIQCPCKPTHDVRDLSFKMQIEIANKQGLTRVSINTADKELKLISGYFQQAVKLDILPKNPCHQVSPGKEAVRTVRDPGYSNTELSQIFSLPLFQARTDAQKVRYGEAPYWLPVILAYTGARAEEIAQLYVKDIKQDKDDPQLWFFHIQEVRDDQSVKTGESRKVPVCRSLIELGLLDYLQSLPVDGRLFPVLKANNKAKYHLAVARHLKEAFMTLNIEHFDTLKPLHAFRHRFITEARKVMREDIQNAITGHSNAGNTGRNYGIYSELHHAIDKMPVVSIPKWLA